MAIREKRWLLSIVTSVVLAVTMLFSPATAFAIGDDGEGGAPELTGTPIEFTNSDGQVVAAYEKDKFVYQAVNSDGQDVAKVYGYKGGGTSINVPETLDGLPVVSVAIDPRYPVDKENYDAVTKMTLPKTMEYHHYFRFFDGLNAVSVDPANPFYKAENGVLIEYYQDEEDSFAWIDFYPRGKSDTSYKIPDYVTEPYRFFEDCPIEKLTLSAKQDAEGNDFWKLRYLESIEVPVGNEMLASVDGVLFTKDKTGLILYPGAKAGTSYTVPDGVEWFDEDAFPWDTELENISLPGSLVDENEAMSTLQNLKNVEFRGAQAPPLNDEEEYDFEGLRDLYYADEDYPEDNGPAPEIKYPAGGTGYEEFITWLKSVNQSENCWCYYDEEEGWVPVDKPELINEEIYVGENLALDVEPDFGEVQFKYSDSKEGPWSETMPTTAGTYYMLAYVTATDKYTGLESEPLEFEIIQQEEAIDNEITSEQTWLWAPWGEELSIDITTKFGAPTFQFKNKSDGKWSDKTPTEIGEYDYRIIVPGVEGQYKALKLSTDSEDAGYDVLDGGISIDMSWENITEFDCESVVEGKTPSPEYSVKEGTPKIEYFTHEAYSMASISYNESEKSWDISGAAALENPPTTAGDYEVVIFLPRTVHCYETYQSCSFEIITKEEADEQTLDDLIDEIRDLKIPSKLTLKDKEAVYKAKAMYETLSDAAKAKLSQKQLAKLNAAIEKVDELQKAVDEEQRIAAAKATYDKQVAAAKALSVNGLKVKAKKGKKANVTWKANKKASGYVIQYSLKKNFKKGVKTVKINKATTKKQLVKKLKAKKTYYFRIAAVSKVKNPTTGKMETYQGKWSKAKKIKAKK